MNRPVIIVGGGLAGCAAAHALDRLGHRAVVLEAAEPGREKACGDCFDVEALLHLQELGLSPTDWRELGGAPTETCAVRAPDGSTTVLQAPGTWHIPRAALDQRLRDRVAPRCDLRYGWRVEAVHPTSDGWTVHARRPAGRLVDLEASAVLLAHGAASPLARALGVDGDPDPAAAVRCYASLAGLDGQAVQSLPGDAPGYAWAFPLADGRANVGVGVFARRGGLRQEAEAWRAGLPATDATPWVDGALSVWSGRGRTWHHPGGLLSAGDAAGLVEPQTGGGIAHALRSGTAAGRSIAAFLAAGRSPHVLALYSAVTRATWSRRFDPDGPHLAPWTRAIRGRCGVAEPYARMLVVSHT